MIYIDPPYNTGNDFIYEDNFSLSQEEYKANSGQYDEQGNRLVANKESNGRFHTDWLNMMYPRLKLARDLLTDDGAIFISIDDNEQTNLKKICDEIFGEQNFIANLIWKNTGGSNTGTNIITVTEYVLIYAKNKGQLQIKLSKKKGDYIKKDEYYKERGGYYLKDLSCKFTSAHYTESLNFPIFYNGKEYWPGGKNTKSDELYNWRWSKEKVEWGIKNGFIIFERGKFKFKNYELVDNSGEKCTNSVPPRNFIDNEKVGSTATGTKELYSIFGNDFFPFPKSSVFIMHLLNLILINKNDVILDFFSGSATTAHAVIKLNAEDGGNRKFIMVQLAEECEEDSVANRFGYKNICEIGKERIRRAGNQIVEELKSKNKDINLDIGFRDLKLDSSNMEDVFYKPDEINQTTLDGLISNIKEDRSSEDLLFQVMLDLGVLLSAKIEEQVVYGKKVFNVDNSYLIACFDEDIDEDIIVEISKKKPTYFVMRDSSLANDSISINFDQIFERYSPDTVRKVL